MRTYVTLFLLGLFLSGCATTKTVTVEDVARSAYFVGCGEAQLNYATNRPEAEYAIKSCREKSLSWDPNHSGTYYEYQQQQERRNMREVGGRGNRY